MSYLEGIRIDFETADMITRLNLIDALEGIDNNIAALEKKDNLQNHQKEDLEDQLKYRAALLVIIRYYSTTEQMKEMKDD
jgi:hypothetical protein